MDRSVFAVVGGDLRQTALANMLAAEGITVYSSGFEQVSDRLVGVASTDPLTAVMMADNVILPMPPTRDGKTLNAPLSGGRIALDDGFCSALTGKAVFAGMAEKLREVSPSFMELDIYDYYQNEAFLLRNAQATAEGALAEVIVNYPRTVCGSGILITGFGRISGFLAPMLRTAGARVTIAARSPRDRAMAVSLGMEAVTFRKALRRAKEYNIVINTVPAPVIDGRFVGNLADDALLVELASAPGGIDREAAGKRHLNVIAAQGLPGKYSPVTAAEIIKETVMSILEEG